MKRFLLVLICSNARIHRHSMRHVAMCFVTNCFTHLCVLSSRDNTDHLQWLVLSELEVAQWWTYLDEAIYDQLWDIYLTIYIYTWVNLITISLLPNPGLMVFKKESSQKGRKFQVSELFSFAHTHIIYIYIYILEYCGVNTPHIHE